jgi:hypothetical protein
LLLRKEHVVPRLEHGPCAVAAVEAWLAIREQKKGPLFCSFSPHGELRETRIDGRVVAAVVKRLFRDAGSSESEVRKIAAHSLRRGFVTSADMAGATTAQIMDVTGHRDPKSLRRYTRRELLHDPVLPKLYLAVDDPGALRVELSLQGIRARGVALVVTDGPGDERERPVRIVLTAPQAADLARATAGRHRRAVATAP